MTKIGIITGSTRPGRNSVQVAEWVKSIADKRGDAEYEIVDLKEYNLPMYAEPISAAYSQDYQTPEAIPWSKKIAELDGYVPVHGFRQYERIQTGGCPRRFGHDAARSGQCLDECV